MPHSLLLTFRLQFYIFLPHWLLSYVVGLALTLLVESPVMGLQKELMHRLAPANMNTKPDLAMTTSPPADGVVKVGGGGCAAGGNGGSIKAGGDCLPTYDQLDRGVEEDACSSGSDSSGSHSPTNNNRRPRRHQQQEHQQNGSQTRERDRFRLLRVPFLPMLMVRRNGCSDGASHRVRIADDQMGSDAATATAATPLTQDAVMSGDTNV